MGKCIKCGKPMNVVELYMSPFCKECVDKEVKRLRGEKK